MINTIIIINYLIVKITREGNVNNVKLPRYEHPFKIPHERIKCM